MKTLLLKTVDFFNLYPFFYSQTNNTATIFMLHSIYPGGNNTGDITTSLLEQYFTYLRDHKYKVLSLSDYIQAIIEKQSTRKCVVFTVDDGYRNFYLNAFEIFHEFNYSATIFLTSDFIEKKLFFWWDTLEFAFQTTALSEIDLGFINMGKKHLHNTQERSDVALVVIRYCKKLLNDEKLALIDKLLGLMKVDISGQPKGKYEPLSWDEIKEMQKAGMEFHPHTKTHPIISRVTKDQKIIELEEPKRLIESRLGSKADIFCYPNGQLDDFDDETIEILKSAGYRAAVTGIEGFDSTRLNTDLFRLKRYPIPHKFIMFKQYISGIETLKNRLRDK